MTEPAQADYGECCLSFSQETGGHPGDCPLSEHWHPAPAEFLRKYNEQQELLDWYREQHTRMQEAQRGGTRMKLIIIAIVAAVAIAMAVSIGTARAEGPALVPGWNLIAGAGETPAAFAAEHACVSIIYVWENDSQRWSHYFVGVPQYVNAYRGIQTMDLGRGYWVYCRA